MIRTSRLSGVPLAESDFADLCALHRDERVTAAFHEQPLTDVDTREFLDEKLAHWREHGFGIWIFRDDSGSFVGRCHLHHRLIEGEDEIDLGYIVRPELWSNGYATEMGAAVIEHGLGELGFDSLAGTTLHDNVRSQHVLEKLGFVYERRIDSGLGVLYRLRAPGCP